MRVGMGKKPWNLTRPTNPADPPARIYTDGYGYRYFKYSDNGRIMVFKFLVEWIPDPPDNIHLNNK